MPALLTADTRAAASSMNADATPNQSAASADFAKCKRGDSPRNSSREKINGAAKTANARAKPEIRCAASAASATQNAGSDPAGATPQHVTAASSSVRTQSTIVARRESMQSLKSKLARMKNEEFPISVTCVLCKPREMS